MRAPRTVFTAAVTLDDGREGNNEWKVRGGERERPCLGWIEKATPSSSWKTRRVKLTTQAPLLACHRHSQTQNQLCPGHSASAAIRHCSMARELEGQKGSWAGWKGGCGGTRPGHEEATAKDSSTHMAGVTVALKRGAKITQSVQLAVCRYFWFPRQLCLNQTEIKTHWKE